MANGKVARRAAAKSKRQRTGSERAAGKRKLRADHLIAAAPQEKDVSNKLGGLKKLREHDKKIAMAAKAEEARLKMLADPATQQEISVFEDPKSPDAVRAVTHWVASGYHTPGGSAPEPSTDAGMVAAQEWGMDPSEVQSWENNPMPSGTTLKM